MQNYKLKFENGRCCTVEAKNSTDLYNEIKIAENRFSCKCIEIDGKLISNATKPTLKIKMS